MAEQAPIACALSDGEFQDRLAWIATLTRQSLRCMRCCAFERTRQRAAGRSIGFMLSRGCPGHIPHCRAANALGVAGTITSILSRPATRASLAPAGHGGRVSRFGASAAWAGGHTKHQGQCTGKESSSREYRYCLVEGAAGSTQAEVCRSSASAASSSSSASRPKRREIARLCNNSWARSRECRASTRSSAGVTSEDGSPNIARERHSSREAAWGVHHNGNHPDHEAARPRMIPWQAARPLAT
jgi:hypothetical protein